MKVKIRYVGGPIGRWMRARRWAGVTLPLPFLGALVLIWATPEEPGNLLELRHEVLGHCPQLERMGMFMYLVRILWGYARHGHYRSPLEVEARRLAGEEPNE